MQDKRIWWQTFWDAQHDIDPVGCDNGHTGWYGAIWEYYCKYWQGIFSAQNNSKKMLECGCGSAKISRHMAGEGYDCTLLDYSTNAIQIARTLNSRHAIQANYIASDIRTMPFHSNSFDVIFSGGVLEFFKDINTPLREMVRVLKPNGIIGAAMVPSKFSIQTIGDMQRTIAHSAYGLIRGDGMAALKGISSTPRHYEIQSHNLEHYKQIFEKAGLTHIVAKTVTPFPELALPRTGQRLYGQLMRKLEPLWHAFNESDSWISNTLGIGYIIHGIKQGNEQI